MSFAFRNPEGELVDNQLYRIMGCARVLARRGRDLGGSMALKYNSYMKDGLHNYLIELRGVNDRRNDDDVEVGIYSTEDKSLLDGSREHLPNQTFAVTSNPALAQRRARPHRRRCAHHRRDRHHVPELVLCFERTLWRGGWTWC